MKVEKIDYSKISGQRVNEVPFNAEEVEKEVIRFIEEEERQIKNSKNQINGL
jgi:hypothetical protein